MVWRKRDGIRQQLLAIIVFQIYSLSHFPEHISLMCGKMCPLYLFDITAVTLYLHRDFHDFLESLALSLWI